MKTVFEHIEQIQEKPHHIRKRIAFGTAVTGTVGIALVWLVSSFSLGTFAIKESSFADASGQENIIASEKDTGSTNVAGAAAALPSVAGPARIEIIDTASTTVGKKKVEQTIIPF